MELGCLFPPTMETPAHIERAEALGYRRALVYDSPAFLADPWVTLALAAARTSRIGLGVGVLTPRLRHVVASAGALATLSTLAPGRIEVGVGAGFTSQLMLGKPPARWAEVEAYTIALRALLRGEEVVWDGSVIGLRYGTRAGVWLSADLPIRIAAHGPRGYAAAERVGDGIITNLSHRGSNPLPPDMGRVQVLYYGTVLEEGEDPGSERVLHAAGPCARVGRVPPGRRAARPAPPPPGGPPRPPDRGDRPGAPAGHRHADRWDDRHRLAGGGAPPPRRDRRLRRGGGAVRPHGTGHPTGTGGIRRRMGLMELKGVSVCRYVAWSPVTLLRGKPS